MALLKKLLEAQIYSRLRSLIHMNRRNNNEAYNPTLPYQRVLDHYNMQLISNELRNRPSNLTICEPRCTLDIDSNPPCEGNLSGGSLGLVSMARYEG